MTKSKLDLKSDLAPRRGWKCVLCKILDHKGKHGLRDLWVTQGLQRGMFQQYLLTFKFLLLTPLYF